MNVNNEVAVSVLPHSYRNLFFINAIFSLSTGIVSVFLVFVVACSFTPSPLKVSNNTCPNEESWYTMENMHCDNSKILETTSSLVDCMGLCKRADDCEGVQWNFYDECGLLSHPTACERRKGSIVKLPSKTVWNSTSFLTYDTCFEAFSEHNWHRFNSLWNSNTLDGTFCTSSEVTECREEWNHLYYLFGSGTHDGYVILGTHDSMSDHCMRTSDYLIKESLLDCTSTRYNKLTLLDWNICKNLLFLKCNAQKGGNCASFLITRPPSTLQTDWFNTGGETWREDDIYFIEACMIAVMCKNGFSLFEISEVSIFQCEVDDKGLSIILNYIDSLFIKSDL